MKNLGYYNGKIGPIEEMQVSMADRAFYFGDGVYDAVLCRNNIPYLLSEHISRLYSNCQRLSIHISKSREQFCNLICELVQKVEGFEKFVYFHVSRGSGLRAHESTPTQSNICVMITPYKKEDLNKKMSTILVSDIRYELCDIKTLNLLPAVLAAQKARELNSDEAIFHRKGIVTEGSHSNVSIIKNGDIITAPADCFILPGVTRAHMIKNARELGVNVREEKYTVQDLMDADEVIITSSSKFLRGVDKIDGKKVGGKNAELLKMLQKSLVLEYLQATNV